MALALGDDTDAVAVRYVRPFGREEAILGIGDSVSLHATDASPELLRRIAAAALELATWRERQIAASAQSRVTFLETGGLAVAS